MTPPRRHTVTRTILLPGQVVATAVLFARAALLATAGPAAAGTVGSSGAGDPYFPLEGNGGYDVRHHDRELVLWPERFAGKLASGAGGTSH
ncbi:hypothetical protein VXC91_41020, partial [Streptomyces chiangmaiensis]|nr:hypothetical protein [Streptomyces chiangmaiensis]